MPTTDTTLEVQATTKYRRALIGEVVDSVGHYRQEAECRLRSGHVLQVQHCGRIVCRECGAAWVDEGF